MKMDIRESFEIYFELVEDPRSQAHITYKQSDILFMLVKGMLCSCTDLEMIIEFAEEKLDFLKKIYRIRRNSMFKHTIKYIKSNKSRPFRIMLIWNIQ